METVLTPEMQKKESRKSFPIQKVRDDFPILHQKIHGKDLVYLDNAASSQKPKQVISAISHFYENDYANIHRGVYQLSQRSTLAYEGARTKVSKFLNTDPKEIVFVRGATEGINLVAHSFVRPMVQEGDEILVSQMEHHSNIVPWQFLREEKGIVLKVIPITDDGQLDLDAAQKLITDKTKFISLVHVSNSLGTINPVEKVLAWAKEKGIPTLLDGAQATPHMSVDVSKLGCDFYVFSGHKNFAPSGIGVLFGKEGHLGSMQPYQGGGEMITSVSFDKTSYNSIPHKFEAGTPNIAGAMALGVAIDYLESLGLSEIEAYEKELLQLGIEKLSQIQGLNLIGTAPEKVAVISFTLDGVHPHDIGTILDQDGIAIRAGHHCTQPVMDRYGIPATARASLAFYNTKEEIDALATSLIRVMKMFG